MNRIVLLLLLLIVLAACTPESETAVSPTPRLATLSPSATAVQSTATAATTPSPSAAAVQPTATAAATTPTPSLAVADLLVISPENVGQLTPLARFGNGRIDSIAWSSDGTMFVVGSSQGVDFYDNQTLQLTQTVQDEQIGGTVQVRLSPSGQFLIMTMGGGEMDRVTLWDSRSGHYVRDLYDAFLTDFSADGLIVYVDWAAQQLVWQDPSSGENTRTMPLPYVPHAFSLASETVAALSLDTSIQLYDMTTGQLHHTLELPDIIDDVVFSPAGDLLATGSRDGFIRLWDVPRGELLHELEGQEGIISGALFSPDGRILATTVGYDKTVRLWDTTTGQLLHQLSGGTGCNDTVMIAFSPDSRELALVSDGTIQFYDTATAALQRSLNNSYCFASDLAFSPDSSTLFTAGSSTVVAVELPGGQWGQSRQTDAPITSIAISPDGQRLAWGGGTNAAWLQMWDTAADQPLYTVAEEADPIHKVAFSPDGHLLGVQSGIWPSPTVQLRTAANGELLASYPANTFAFTPDGRFLATSITPYAAETAGLALWDTTTFLLAYHFDSLTLLSISPEGSLFASEEFSSVSWWDIDSAARLRPFLLTEGPIAVHAFSPDGRLFLGTGPYGFMDMWDTTTGQGVWSQYDGQRGVFSPDGRYLATVSHDGIVRLWGVVR